MNKLIQKQLNFLEESIAYYDTPEKFCKKDGEGCFYDPAKAKKQDLSDGCAIGRHLPPELKKKFDALADMGSGNTTIRDIYVDHPSLYELIPDHLKELGLGFLEAMQTWHDNTAMSREFNLDKFREEIQRGKYTQNDN